MRINSLLQRPGVCGRPIQIHLRPSTYRRYRQDWVRMISFVYRTSHTGRHFHLQHQLTNDQLISLDRMEEYARHILRGNNEDRSESPQLKPASTLKTKNEMAPGLTQRLDDACLELSIALLDHELWGDLFESAVV